MHYVPEKINYLFKITLVFFLEMYYNKNNMGKCKFLTERRKAKCKTKKCGRGASKKSLTPV
jgi:hypothetical protein